MSRQERDAWDPGALVAWFGAVLDHRPGEVDAPLAVVASVPSDRLRTLWLDLQLLVSVITQPRSARVRVEVLEQVTTLTAQGRPSRNVRLRPDHRKVLDDLAAKARVVGLNPLLRRAMMLHTDVVTLAAQLAGAAGGSVSTTASLRVFVGDGSSLGAENVSLHWELARQLANRVTPVAGADAFVRAWYAATVALSHSTESFDSIQLQAALRTCPGDARLLFLAGCEREAFAAPLFQEFAKAFRQSRMRPAFGDASDELVNAERYFRQALVADPALHEAGMRLGRVLGQRGQHVEAAALLSRALAAPLDTPTAYFASLFLGAELEAMGRVADARDAYERASTLMPRARVPHLALASVLRQLGDREAASGRLTRALAVERDEDIVEPWFAYRRAHARHAEDEMSAVRRMMVGDTP
jgi:Flp pilus assembly protein TadD